MLEFCRFKFVSSVALGSKSGVGVFLDSHRQSTDVNSSRLGKFVRNLYNSTTEQNFTVFDRESCLTCMFY